MSVTQLNVAPGVDQYTLINQNKTLAVMILNYGATVTHILTPDKTGVIRDVVLGFDTYEDYKNEENPYFGAVIGRFANRLGEGKFTVNGKEYSLAINNGPNALHGGLEGFDKKIFKTVILSQDPPSIKLELTSPDGDQGYPGNLDVTVVYTVTKDDELMIEYKAITTDDKDTIVNLTNHSYFNLSGVELNPSILDHRVTMADDIKAFLACDSNNLPTGQVVPLSEAPWMSFSGENEGQSIGLRMDNLTSTRGYDHPYVIHTDYQTDTASLPLRHIAEVYCPETGIELDFSTTDPAFQFYTGGYISSSLKAKKDQGYTPIGPSSGFCLEACRNPDAPNKPDWRSSVLVSKDHPYTSKTVYAFHARLD